MDDVKKFEPFWDSWYITGELGEGGFGKVYKIERKEFKNTYKAAHKHIKVPQSSSEVRSIFGRYNNTAYGDGNSRKCI